jgi:hypothetical protein
LAHAVRFLERRTTKSATLFELGNRGAKLRRDIVFEIERFGPDRTKLTDDCREWPRFNDRIFPVPMLANGHAFDLGELGQQRAPLILRLLAFILALTDGREDRLAGRHNAKADMARTCQYVR